MKLIPLDDRVIVTPVEADEVTAGGVILPGSAKEKPNKGKVQSVGPGEFISTTGDRRPVGVKKGDVVFYGKYAGTDVKVGGQEFKILRAKDILGIEV